MIDPAKKWRDWSFNPKPGSPKYKTIHKIGTWGGWLDPLMANTNFEQLPSLAGQLLQYVHTSMWAVKDPNALTRCVGVAAFAGQALIRKWFDADSNDAAYIDEVNQVALNDRPGKEDSQPVSTSALAKGVDYTMGFGGHVKKSARKQVFKQLVSLFGNVITLVNTVSRGWDLDAEKNPKAESVRAAIESATTLVRPVVRTGLDDGLGNFAPWFRWWMGASDPVVASAAAR